MRLFSPWRLKAATGLVLTLSKSLLERLVTLKMMTKISFDFALLVSFSVGCWIAILHLSSERCSTS